MLTVLGRGGEGREFRKANHTPSDRMKEQETERDRKTVRAETDRERWYETQKETPLPEFNETSSERRTQKGHKTT